ncbi:TPA: hypothetical protein ACH3X2_002129 [Trebouxia sp. C0005]|nr:MAG: hypothetical protein FRX49_11997 [Trebouxia sp. A1-2]
MFEKRNKQAKLDALRQSGHVTMLSPSGPPRSIHRIMQHTTRIRIKAGVTGELSTLRQMMEVPNEPGLSPNNGLENAPLSDQSMASNSHKGQAKRSGAKTTSHDGKAGHVMTHVGHRVRQEERQV